MKKLLLILFLSTSYFVANSQGMATSGTQFSTRADLRKQVAFDKVMVTLSGLVTEGDKNGGIYQWDSLSTATDDGVLVIKVDNVVTGRWIKKLNDNTIKGSVVMSGVALQTAYPITFTTALPFIPSMVVIQPTSINAAALSWVSNKSTTGFTVNFLSVPILGTNNITFDYIVIKQ